MESRRLGKFGPVVSALGFGAFKIGRNQRTKYGSQYEIPSEASAARLLNELLDLGVSLIDTSPAYGLSEERIGAAIGRRRREFTLSTKIGEQFENGVSSFDFSRTPIEASVRRSLALLKTDVLDFVFIHSPGDDLAILHQTDAVPTLQQLKSAGLVKAIGLSGKTIEGARAALAWADALMVEYHLEDQSHHEVIVEAGERGVGVVVKKGLSSGRLPPKPALEFLLANPHVSSVLVGSLSLEHMRENLDIVRT